MIVDCATGRQFPEKETWKKLERNAIFIFNRYLSV